MVFVSTENSWLLFRSFPKEKQKRFYCVHMPSRLLHTTRGGGFPSQDVDCGYEKQAIVGVMGRVAEMELLSL